MTNPEKIAGNLLITGIVVFAVWSSPAWSQGGGQLPGAVLLQISEITLRNQENCNDQWETAYRTINDAREKAEVPRAIVWQRLVGETRTYRIVRPNFDASRIGQPVEYMEQDAFNEQIRRLRSCTAKRHVYFAMSGGDANIRLPDGQDWNLGILRTRQVKSGKMGEYLQWLTEDLFGAYRAAESDGHLIARIVAGGNPNTVTTMNHLASWDDYALGAPAIVEVIGQERWGQIVGRISEFSEGQTVEIYRRRNDL